jgi:hypothetical protein
MMAHPNDRAVFAVRSGGGGGGIRNNMTNNNKNQR